MLNYIAVAIGGALGALLRSIVYEYFAETGNVHLFPLPTLIVNIVGSILMGIGWFCLIEQSMLPAIWKNFALTGMLGALTTFSTFSLDSFRLLQSGQLLEALAYVLISVTVCFLGLWLGYQTVKWLVGA
ncbi:MAG: fluoride efflux transporter CrcB [Endozoicomonas sp. (ex Botrylloides leachii)]|nr:fluoride efflux transporter CrcB [Endozoicomonas sp. (ex Botrylloides leachii)]